MANVDIEPDSEIFFNYKATLIEENQDFQRINVENEEKNEENCFEIENHYESEIEEDEEFNSNFEDEYEIFNTQVVNEELKKNIKRKSINKVNDEKLVPIKRNKRNSDANNGTEDSFKLSQVREKIFKE